MDIFSWAAWLEASPLGDWMRNDALAYPVANVLHLIGLTLLVAPILLLDLRLLGVGRVFPLRATSAALTRCAALGITLLFATGVLMFSADAVPLIRNPVMQTKLLVIAFGLVNAGLFRTLWRRRIDEWDDRPALLGRVQAFTSIILWLGVASLGRWIAYS